MIRSFGLHDVFLMLSLQRSSAALAIENILTHPRAPLWIALTAPWPWAGIGVATYVLRDTIEDMPVSGFSQLMKRAARPEADLLHLAPALPTTSMDEAVGEAIWGRLLGHCALAAGGHGLQRVYASITDGSPEEACLREAGFSLYTRETIHRLALAPESRREPQGSRAAGFRPQGPQDSWALQRLYTRGTPRLVQQAEGAVTGDVGSPPLSWWEPDRWRGIVWEPAGEARAAVQVHIGRAGHWLRIWGTNMLAPRELRALVAEGLRVISGSFPHRDRKALPVYATVRDYEIGLGSVLTGFGFAPYASRARFVRHTGAVRQPETSVARAGLEGSAHQEMPIRSQTWRT